MKKEDGPMFKLKKNSPADRELVIQSPGVNLVIDYDVPDGPEVLKFAKRIVRVLNQNWDAPSNSREGFLWPSNPNNLEKELAKRFVHRFEGNR